MPAVYRSILALGIDEIGVACINATLEAVAAADGEPVFVDDAAAFADRRPAPRAIVLQATKDPVRFLRTDCDVIELPQGRGIDVVPVAASIVADIKAAIAADKH